MPKPRAYCTAMRNDASPRRAGMPHRWWLECIIVLSFYGIYTLIRNQFGSAVGASVKDISIQNAYDMIAIERSLHLFIEKGIQDLFITWEWFIRFWNIFYGFCHFAVTIGVMVFLFVRHPRSYSYWRTVLAATTGLALIGFAFYPLMPPRLLNDFGPHGAADGNYSFVDTLVELGGFWSFESGAMQEISNQYAAMPSLHISWAIWCAVAAVPLLRRRWSKWAMASYPLLTLFSVVVTANHYWIDAVGGALVFAVGWIVGSALIRAWNRLGSGSDPDLGQPR